MPIIFKKDQKTNDVPIGVHLNVIVGRHMGAAAITMGEATIDPGGKIRLHTHKIEESIMIAEGRGAAVVGEQRSPVEVGDTILAPAGVPHSIINDSDRPLRIVFAYPAIEPEREFLE